MNNNFFGNPTQVAFFDKIFMRYVGGIARFNEIIDFRDGEVINIEEYLAKMKNEKGMPQYYLSHYSTLLA